MHHLNQTGLLLRCRGHLTNFNFIENFKDALFKMSHRLILQQLKETHLFGRFDFLHFTCWNYPSASWRFKKMIEFISPQCLYSEWKGSIWTYLFFWLNLAASNTWTLIFKFQNLDSSWNVISTHCQIKGHMLVALQQRGEGYSLNLMVQSVSVWSESWRSARSVWVWSVVSDRVQSWCPASYWPCSYFLCKNVFMNVFCTF